MDLYPPAVEVINKILQKGVSQENILKIFEIYSQYPYSLEKFASDIDTYGGIQGAISKGLVDYVRINMATQGPASTNDSANTETSYRSDIIQE